MPRLHSLVIGRSYIAAYMILVLNTLNRRYRELINEGEENKTEGKH